MMFCQARLFDPSQVLRCFLYYGCPLPARVIGSSAILEICESQTSVLLVPDLALVDRAVYSAGKLKIENGGHKTQNTRDNANLIFYSYSKQM